MLVLSRKVGQVRVRIASVDGSRVRLAIAAPRHIAVLREEVWVRDCAHTSSLSNRQLALAAPKQ
jgi:carbon storage regulator CsrA